MNQMDLFTWADSKASNVIDVMPYLIRKAAMEVIYCIPNKRGDGKVARLEERKRA